MARTIYQVIDKDEKRVKLDYYDRLNLFVAAVSRNPRTIMEFSYFYKEIAGESFYQEGPKTVEELGDYLITQLKGKSRPKEYSLVARLKTKNKNVWFIVKNRAGEPPVTNQWHARRRPIYEYPKIPKIDKWLAELTTIQIQSVRSGVAYQQRIVGFHDYQKSGNVSSSEVKPITTDFLRRLYHIQDASKEEVVRRFQLTVNDYTSVNPDERVQEDIPEITPELIKEWQRSPHRNEFPTVQEYRRYPKVNGRSIDGIVVADLRKKELRYLAEPRGFTIPWDRPTDFDKKCGTCSIPYCLPSDWRLIQE